MDTGKKDQILTMARNGGRKPHWKTILGSALGNYCNPLNYGYDKDFCSIIKAERPDWFESKSLRNKMAILQAVEAGKTRKEAGTVLEKAFIHYTNPKNDSFDAAFVAIMMAKAPKWFIRRKAPNKKKTKQPPNEE